MLSKKDVPHAEWPAVGELMWIQENLAVCERLDNWLPMWPWAGLLPYEHTNKDNPDDWFG